MSFDTNTNVTAVTQGTTPWVVSGTVTVIPGPAGSVINTYSEVAGVAMGATAPVATYTIPVGHTFALTRILFSSDSLSTFELDLNGSTTSKKRIYYTMFNDSFEFLNQQNGYTLPAGTVISVKATNDSSAGAATFNANIEGVLT